MVDWVICVLATVSCETKFVLAMAATLNKLCEGMLAIITLATSFLAVFLCFVRLFAPRYLELLTLLCENDVGRTR
jgi:hypothetical protein